MNNDLYRLIPEEGKHLADSHDTVGAFRGVYLDDKTNKPCGAGEFVKVDPSEYRISFKEKGELIFLGIVIAKAYPHIEKYVLDKVIPAIKKFWNDKIKLKFHPKNLIYLLKLFFKNIKKICQTTK